MGFSNFLSLGTTQQKLIDAGSIAHAVTDGVAAPAFIIAAIALNNTSTTDGETSEVSEVKDQSGRQFTKIKEFCNSQGAANAGATISLWGLHLTSGIILSGTNITATFTGSATASAMAVGYRGPVAGESVSLVASATAADDGADPQSIDLTTPNSEHWWIRAIAHEGPDGDTFTKTASYSSSQDLGTTGGAAGSNMCVAIEEDLLTGTSNASNPAWTARDNANVLVALKSSLVTNACGWIGKGGWF